MKFKIEFDLIFNHKGVVLKDIEQMRIDDFSEVEDTKQIIVINDFNNNEQFENPDKLRLAFTKMPSNPVLLRLFNYLFKGTDSNYHCINMQISCDECISLSYEHEIGTFICTFYLSEIVTRFFELSKNKIKQKLSNAEKSEEGEEGWLWADEINKLYDKLAILQEGNND